VQKVSAQPLATHVGQIRQALDFVGRPLTPEQGRALDAALRPRPREVVAIYARRWSIEVLFKELRQDLGLADYQMLAEEGVLHHLHVCCLAQLLLTHRSLDALGAKAKDGHEQVTLPPT
jgi:hypothetical protein